MSEINTPVTRLGEAEALVAQLVKQVGDIDNLIVAFTLRDRSPMSVVVGTTGHSPTMWVLGALDHIRWHVFNAMTMHKYAKDEETAQAVQIVDHLKKEGRLN